jgi:Protein of unknown function (DUF3431)
VCGTGCCAEFVASRQRIKARPKQFYVKLMERLDNLGPGDESSPYAVEHIWHAIFVSLRSKLELPVHVRQARHIALAFAPFNGQHHMDVPTRLVHMLLCLSQGEPWVSYGIGKCELLACRCAQHTSFHSAAQDSATSAFTADRHSSSPACIIRVDPH